MTKKNNSYWIIGLTGKNASGKGSAASVLQSMGYSYFSLSDALRMEASKRGIGNSRLELTNLGRLLRQQDGPGVLASRLSPLLAISCSVVDSIRHPAEVAILKTLGNFALFGIDAPIETRFKRAMGRGRDESALTLEEFEKVELRECSNEAIGQQLDKCLEIADAIIHNDSSLDQLPTRVRDTMIKLGFPTQCSNARVSA